MVSASNKSAEQHAIKKACLWRSKGEAKDREGGKEVKNGKRSEKKGSEKKGSERKGSERNGRE